VEKEEPQRTVTDTLTVKNGKLNVTARVVDVPGGFDAARAISPSIARSGLPSSRS
jgi:hypothetical protein